jgi:hypothetical protein
MDPKVRNVIAEVLTIVGIAIAALPDLSAATHVPAWVGVALAFVTNVGNQILKQFPPAP